MHGGNMSPTREVNRTKRRALDNGLNNELNNELKKDRKEALAGCVVTHE